MYNSSNILFALVCLLTGCIKQPEACFEIENTKVDYNDPVIFENCSEFADNYQWDFGDGKTSIDINPSHGYDLPGFYTAILRVFNEKGEDEYSINIDVGRFVLKSFQNSMQTDSFTSPIYVDCFQTELFIENERVGIGRSFDGGEEPCSPIVPALVDGSIFGPTYSIPVEFSDYYIRMYYTVQNDTNWYSGDDTLWPTLPNIDLSDGLNYTGLTFTNLRHTIKADVQFLRVNDFEVYQ